MQFLSRTSSDKAFWCHDGRVFYTLEEFSKGLEEMKPETFSYHANANKNDFSKWVVDVFGDKKLAEDLIKAKNKSEAAKKVKLRIAYLKKIAK